MPDSATTIKVAVAVLILYIGFVILLITMRDDFHWDRLVYSSVGSRPSCSWRSAGSSATTVAHGAVEDAKSA